MSHPIKLDEHNIFSFIFTKMDCVKPDIVADWRWNRNRGRSRMKYRKKVVSTMCYLHTHYVFTSNTIFICVYFSNADQGVYCTHSSESDFSVSVCFFSGISIFFLSAWSVELHMSNLMFLNCGVSILIWFSSIVYIMIVKFVHSKTENLTYIIVMKIEDWWLM